MSKRKIKGGILTTIGYLLSPVSWWNDLVINIPLAYGFGFLLGLISKKLFLPMMIIGYWITNIVGFMLMHYGVKDFISKEEGKNTKKELKKGIIISLVYTIIVIVIMKMGWPNFPSGISK